MNKKAQVSMEFIITIILVLAIFGFGMFLFQNRTSLNQTAFQQWRAQEVANMISRNVNNVFLMDDNSYYFDNIYWNAIGQSIEIGPSVVRVVYSNGQAVTAPLLAEVTWNITDVNGGIYFRKQNNGVVVSYE